MDETEFIINQNQYLNYIIDTDLTLLEISKLENISKSRVHQKVTELDLKEIYSIAVEERKKYKIKLKRNFIKSYLYLTTYFKKKSN